MILILHLVLQTPIEATTSRRSEYGSDTSDPQQLIQEEPIKHCQVLANQMAIIRMDTKYKHAMKKV